MTDLYFWGQSLDNQARDVIFKNGKELSDDESRQQLVSEIYEFPKSDSEVVSADSAVTIRYSYSKFVIEAIPTEKDELKRLAPIVIYGVLPDGVLEASWVDKVYEEINNFVSNTLNRNLNHSTLATIKGGLSEILKKKTEDSQINLLSRLKRLLERLANCIKLLGTRC
ncbi:hypothetical protein QUB70_17675 [Microcoleus sp. A003_D6]|uniref:hypothetical protein n=1 Tax=Microcoleus sp. A003_D6 TaxID=3055266 RepID=UPI002FD251EE